MNKVTSSRHPLSEWIYDVLQNVVIHTNSHISTTNEPEQPEPDHKKSQKLIDGAYFNEKIINTYPWVILGIVLVISSIHWSGELLRWRNRVLQKRNERYSYDILDDEPLASKPVREDVILIDYGSASSSGSSTSGSNTPSIQSNTEDEHIPLLEGRFSKSSSNRITIKSQIKAFLIYQPRPLPYFNKVLPSNSSSLFILSFLALNIFYTFYNITFTAFEASVLGDRAGLVFGVNLPLLYLLGAKNQPLKLLTGVSYESLNILHRRLGEILMVAALIHAGGMFIMWYTFLQPFRGWTLWAYLSHPCIYFGLLALFTYKLLYVTSLASFRQRWYEVFLGLHVVLQASALIILYFHHRGTRAYVGWAIVVFLVDRLVYRLCAKSTMAEANIRVFPDNQTLLLTFQLPKVPTTILSQSLGHSITRGWRATDHVFLTVPSLGRTHALQAHPFTIASPAPHPSSNTSTLSLLIRARSGFSLDLLRAGYLKKTLQCRLDGPYGSSHARSLVEDSDLAILVAGGSGIAVMWPIVHYLLDSEKEEVGEDAENGFVGLGEIGGVGRKKRKGRIVLLWIIHKSGHIEWIDERERSEVEERGVDIIIPGATMEVGRPDLEGLMDGIVGYRGFPCEKESTRKIRVVVSGPDGLNRTINNKCAALVREGEDLQVTVEKFGW